MELGPAVAGDPAQLFSADLHDVEIPGQGAGWTEVDGARTEFDRVPCVYQGDGAFPKLTAQGIADETPYGPVILHVSRMVFDQDPVAVETVHFLVKEDLRGGGTVAEGWLRVTPADGTPQWQRGSSEIPAIHIADEEPHWVLTAAGVLETGDNGDDLVSGNFTAALTCGADED